MSDLHMFGELEIAPDSRMVVRAIGHVLGTSASWFHFGGLSVIFPIFQTKHPKLIELIGNMPPNQVCLAIDFYTGEVKIIEGTEETEDKAPKVHHSLQLRDLLPQ